MSQFRLVASAKGPRRSTFPARAALLLTAAAAVILLAGVRHHPAAARPGENDPITQATAFYEARPRFYRPVPFQETPEGLPDISAATCGQCHVEIYNEWRISTHARAWLDDPQYQAELEKTTATPGRDTGWICINCHTPLMNQLPKLVTGLTGGALDRPIYVDNPRFDRALQDDAITCAVCHVRDGVILGPFGDTDAPHPVRRTEALRSPEFCAECHQAEAIEPDINLACLFDTGRSYAAGPWAAEGHTCQSCHMPEVVRPMTDGSTDRRPTRRHWFAGSRIPKKPEFAAELAPLAEHFPDGARIEWLARPAAVRAGARDSLSFAVTNAHAGHTLPTGDVERFLLVTARITDGAGRVLAERTERFGTRYEWYPKVAKLGDNRLAPRETRRFTLPFTAPAPGPLVLTLEGRNERISPENMAWHHLEGRYVAGREFLHQVDTLSVR